MCHQAVRSYMQVFLRGLRFVTSTCIFGHIRSVLTPQALLMESGERLTTTQRGIMYEAISVWKNSHLSKWPRCSSSASIRQSICLSRWVKAGVVVPCSLRCARLTILLRLSLGFRQFHTLHRNATLFSRMIVKPASVRGLTLFPYLSIRSPVFLNLFPFPDTFSNISPVFV
jgi:hypothetical protein